MVKKEKVDLLDDRENRYRDRLDVLEERLELLEEWTEPGPDELSEHRKDMYAVFKAFQEAVEALTDVCTMFLSDTGRGLGDDRENIVKASGRLFSEALQDDLTDANGLRNRIVHDYLDFDDKIALIAIQDFMKNMSQFEEEVREWLDQN